ncbi:PREDICTED: cysteinyl leukotriene receptor 2 [Chrysochloris asiatica]|uniref:Cysteinyl leukotriene receptor 2 n=1 Tax=Chrysochloris asiatica TaxID=185453 RepID=A0A9B0T6E7_CHRAS|nr:PREDICTED: cysteinyl leukotriene receptor 2 [Chrysochloris asiatica]
MDRKPTSLPLSSSKAEMEQHVNFSNNSSCIIDNFKREFYPVMYLIIFIWGALGNGFSIFVFLQPYKKSTPVNIFMLNLAISDLLFTTTLPFRVDYYLRGSNWIFGDLACRIMSYSMYANMYSSIYFLTVLSVVRFLATVHPFRLLHITSIRSAWVLCGVIWILIVIPLAVLLNSEAQKNNVTLCLELNNNKADKLQILNHITLVMGFLLPFCTLSICYLLIIRTLLKVEVPESGPRISHRKALTTIIISLIIFFLCFLPYHILRTLHLAVWQTCKASLHKAVVITLTLAAANTCLNPLLYYFAGENFQDRLRAILSKGHPHMIKTNFQFPVCVRSEKETRV